MLKAKATSTKQKVKKRDFFSASILPFMIKLYSEPKLS